MLLTKQFDTRTKEIYRGSNYLFAEMRPKRNLIKTIYLEVHAISLGQSIIHGEQSLEKGFEFDRNKPTVDMEYQKIVTDLGFMETSTIL